MGRSRKVLVLLSISLLCLSAIYFYAGSIAPMDMEIDDIGPEAEGKFVRVEGVVREASFFDDSASLELVDVGTGAMTKVYCRSRLPDATVEKLRPGARTVVVGEVEMFKGLPEVVVTKDDEVWVTAPPDANEVPLKTIFMYRDSFENMTVSVWGVVQGDPDMSWGDAVFTVKEGKYEAKVRVSDFSPQVPFREGSSVRVVGKVWFEGEGHIRISANGWTSVTVDI